MRRLEHLLDTALVKHANAIAVVDTEGCWSYQQLHLMSNQMANALLALGVNTGDRVGLWLEKSAKSIAAMHAVMKLNAVYVPLDPLSPLSRIKTIVVDCAMAVIITTENRWRIIQSSKNIEIPLLLVDGSGEAIDRSINRYDVTQYSTNFTRAENNQSDTLAYILYTSGSTGTPKGVCITHENSRAFVDWALTEIAPCSSDRFANHAPFHFDLSVFDIYVTIGCGATVYIIPEVVSYLASSLVTFVKDNAITIWYSVPSALILMMDSEHLFSSQTSSLNTIIFAGEPFPIADLRSLRGLFKLASLYNFYGPTETNVCTFYKVGIQVEDSLPIGKACSENSVWVESEEGKVLGVGGRGELFVEGGTVFQQYWGKPKRTSSAYGTGDIVYVREDGHLMYVGRRDHMVKVRGYRIELGDIESALCRFEKIKNAAVLIVGEGADAKIIACLVLVAGVNCSLLEVKGHCVKWLPRYMIVDSIKVVEELPRNANGKIDRLKLSENIQ